MASSSSVLLDNVDDYLAPSQACINPLFQPLTKSDNDVQNSEKKTSPAVVVPRRRRRRTVNITSTPSVENSINSSPLSNDKKDPKKVVKASIVDCLACSGCVTTAETVLLEQQHSLESLRKRLLSSNAAQIRAITVSPNSWADMCRHWGFSSSDETCQKMTTLLNQILQAQIVVDGNLPLQWTWLDEAQEFTELYKQQQGKRRDIQALPPSSAVNFSETLYYQTDGTTRTVNNNQDEHNVRSLPLISGSCPALVCLVEKSMSNLVPNLSSSQSPMSRIGSILKCNRPDANVNQWDHWAIMPCHDKKLEASRQDFIYLDPKRKAVDLVISTSECIELVEEWIKTTTQDETMTVASYLETIPKAQKLEVIHPDELNNLIPPSHSTFVTTPTIDLLQSTEQNQVALGPDQMAFSSGGHASFIFAYAAKELFNCSLSKINWQAASFQNSKPVKSARLARAQKLHFYKAQLFLHEDGTYSQIQSNAAGNPVLEFTIAHGMQTMQRALKEVGNNNCATHYMEAMACPYGCVNGGGAAKTTIGRETPTETRQRVQATIKALKLPNEDNSLDNLSDHHWRTRYHVVPPMQHTLGATAGVKVDDIKW